MAGVRLSLRAWSILYESRAIQSSALKRIRVELSSFLKTDLTRAD